MSNPDLPRQQARTFPRRLLLLTMAVLLGLALMPAIAATMVNRLRVERARRDLDAIARRAVTQVKRGGTPAGFSIPRGREAERGVVWFAGPGNLPRMSIPEALEMVRGEGPAQRLLQSPSGEPVGPDPWHNAYLLAVRTVAPSPPAVPGGVLAWVVSAGPNGTVETTLSAAAVTAGDDLIVAVPCKAAP